MFRDLVINPDEINGLDEFFIALDLIALANAEEEALARR